MCIGLNIYPAKSESYPHLLHRLLPIIYLCRLIFMLFCVQNLHFPLGRRHPLCYNYLIRRLVYPVASLIYLLLLVAVQSLLTVQKIYFLLSALFLSFPVKNAHTAAGLSPLSDISGNGFSVHFHQNCMRV